LHKRETDQKGKGEEVFYSPRKILPKSKKGDKKPEHPIFQKEILFYLRDLIGFVGGSPKMVEKGRWWKKT